MNDRRELAAPKSVVIRPFANLSEDKALEYLAAGTTGELGRRLSRVQHLRIFMSSGATGPADPSRLASLELRGHVQQAGKALRVTVQLNDVREGTLVWSQNFDGSRGQTLELQEQLGAETVAAIARLQGADGSGAITRAAALLGFFAAPDPSTLPPTGTRNNAAFDFYLRGRALFDERTLPDALQAIEYLKRAIRLDPNFADPYATLADVQGVLMDFHHAPHDTLLAEAEGYALQAVSLNPQLPEAQLSLAALRQSQWRWNEAEAAYKRAIELHPLSGRAQRWYGGLLLQFGEFDRAFERYRRAIDLDPYDYPSQSAYGHALFNAGRAQEAAAHLEQLLSRNDLFYAHALLGQVYAHLVGADPAGREDYLKKALDRADMLRARELAVRTTEEPPVTEYADLVAALAWSSKGDLAAAAPYVDRLEAYRARGPRSPAPLARVYAVQGQTTRVMTLLLEAEAQHDRELLYVNVSPHYARIRQEPQFRALLKRIGLAR
jgi:TolB-like protein/Tfp pilus assembly protein PilF